MTLESCGQARALLGVAVAGLKGVAASLREASALMSEVPERGELQTHAAVADANAAGIERLITAAEPAHGAPGHQRSGSGTSSTGRAA